MRLLTCTVACLVGLSALAQADEPSDIFIVTTTAKKPAAVVEAVKSYAEDMQWRYIGDSKVKQGEVTLVKICIPEVGRAVWPAGLQLSALLPCGNLGIYETESVTEISLLHPRYMHILYPDPATEQASEIALPLLSEMLDAVAD